MSNAIDGAVASAPTTTTAAATDASATTAAAARQKRGTRTVTFVTKGIKFIYVYRMIKAFIRAITRTVYSKSVYMMSRTILFTLGKKPVMAPPVVLVQKITVMKTTIKTIKTKVSTVRVQNLAAMTAAGETATTQLSDYENKLDVGTVESVVENEVVATDKAKNMEKTLKALMANRIGLQKTVTLLIKIVTQDYTIDSSSEVDAEHIIEKAEGVDALANCLYGAEMERTVILDLSAELYRYVGFEFKLMAAPTTEELTSITTIVDELNTQIVAISKVILETQTLVIRQVGAKFDPKTLAIQTISLEEGASYGAVITPEVTVVEETSTSTTIQSAAEIEKNLVDLRKLTAPLRTESE